MTIEGGFFDQIRNKSMCFCDGGSTADRVNGRAALILLRSSVVHSLAQVGHCGLHGVMSLIGRGLGRAREGASERAVASLKVPMAALTCSKSSI